MRALLWCGVAAGPLFVIVFLVAGALRGDGYSALRHPVSSLAFGPQGWVQVANFVVTGALVIAFAAGLRRDGVRAATWRLVGVVGIGLIGAGLFAADPIGGYPPGTPLVSPRTVVGELHRIVSTGVFAGIPAAALTANQNGRSFATCSAATAVAFLTCFVLAGVGFAQDSTFAQVGGLMHRLALIIGLAWIAALALVRLRAAGLPLA